MRPLVRPVTSQSPIVAVVHVAVGDRDRASLEVLVADVGREQPQRHLDRERDARGQPELGVDARIQDEARLAMPYLDLGPIGQALMRGVRRGDRAHAEAQAQREPTRHDRSIRARLPPDREARVASTRARAGLRRPICQHRSREHYQRKHSASIHAANSSRSDAERKPSHAVLHDFARAAPKLCGRLTVFLLWRHRWSPQVPGR